MNGNSVDNYRITDRESLNLFLKNKNIKRGRFIIEAASMDENTARNYENKLNRYYASCGCTTGNYFLMIALVLCVAYFLITGREIGNWKIIVQVLSILLIAAILGKFAGKIMDGFKFKKTASRLRQELT